jgi:hypothetical protein
MANIQIPNLPTAIALNGQEQLEAVQAGTSVRVTSSQIAGLAFGSLAEVTPGTVIGRFSDSAIGPAQELPIAVDSLGNVGIGGNPVAGKLDVIGSNTVGVYDGRIGVYGSDYPYVELFSNADVGYGGGYAITKSRGTRSSPAIVQNGDGVGEIAWVGYDGATYPYTANIASIVNGAPGADDMPGALLFGTTADGGTFPTERMRITSAGDVGIGTSSPSDRLHISGEGNPAVRVSGTGTSQFSGGLLQLNAPDASTNFGGTRLLHMLLTGASDLTDTSFLVQKTTTGGVFISNYYEINYKNDFHRWSTDGSIERMRIDSAGNVGIGTSAPDASALLDVTSTTGGVLFPRMTSTQRDAIGSPANGLVLYNTTTDKLQVRAGGSWVDLH